jgi:hypothetical protein
MASLKLKSRSVGSCCSTHVDCWLPLSSLAVWCFPHTSLAVWGLLLQSPWFLIASLTFPWLLGVSPTLHHSQNCTSLLTSGLRTSLAFPLWSDGSTGTFLTFWRLSSHFQPSLMTTLSFPSKYSCFCCAYSKVWWLCVEHFNLHNMLYRRVLCTTHSWRFTTAWTWVEHFYALHCCMKHFHIHLLLYGNTCTHSTAVRNISMPSMLPWSQVMLHSYYWVVKIHFHIW